MIVGRRSKVTVKNYRYWLRPWVKELSEGGDGGVRVVSRDMIKAYLDRHYGK